MTHVQMADGREECGASTISPLCTAIYHCPCSHHLDNRVIACFSNICHNFQSVWNFFAQFVCGRVWIIMLTTSRFLASLFSELLSKEVVLDLSEVLMMCHSGNCIDVSSFSWIAWLLWLTTWRGSVCLCFGTIQYSKRRKSLPDKIFSLICIMQPQNAINC